MNPLVSILIPYHDTPQTAFFLSRVLSSIDAQTYKNVEIVLMKEGKMGENYNACIRKAKGSILKFMGMDDYFASTTSLETIVRQFDDPQVHWLCTGCLHEYKGHIGNPHVPAWNDAIYRGNNTLGGFSVVAIRNTDVAKIDETLDWTVDVDWYWRVKEKYGPPRLINDLSVVIGLGEHQTTNTLTEEQKLKEWKLTSHKYA